MGMIRGMVENYGFMDEGIRCDVRRFAGALRISLKGNLALCQSDASYREFTIDCSQCVTARSCIEANSTISNKKFFKFKDAGKGFVKITFSNAYVAQVFLLAFSEVDLHRLDGDIKRLSKLPGLNKVELLGKSMLSFYSENETFKSSLDQLVSWKRLGKVVVSSPDKHTVLFYDSDVANHVCNGFQRRQAMTSA